MMATRLPTFASQRGFTLIELVAAFLIFALAFGVLMQILSSAMHTTTQSADYTKAALWAQSLLDTQGIGEPLQEGSRGGRFDEQFSWQLRVAKYEPPQMPIAGNSAFSNVVAGAGPGANATLNTLELYQLELIVTWGSFYLTHNARFTTLRVINPAQQVGNVAGQRSALMPQTPRQN